MAQRSRQRSQQPKPTSGEETTISGESKICSSFITQPDQVRAEAAAEAEAERETTRATATIKPRKETIAASLLSPPPLLLLLLAIVTLNLLVVQLTFACHRVYFQNNISGNISSNEKEKENENKNTNNFACQCDLNQCDSLQFEWPTDEHAYLLVSSDAAGRRFEQSQQLTSGPADGHRRSGAVDYALQVRANQRLQQVEGFGGAFTDSASLLIGQLPGRLKQRLLDDYFGPHGLDYSMGRMPIAGTDMSTRPYSYNDLPRGQQDFELRHFRLQAEDLEYRIPLIRRANAMRASRKLEPLKLVASSWSAPGWMKTNGELVQGALAGNSSGPFYGAYARYIIRFLDEYERHNIPMWALTPQNEPYTPSRVGPKVINFNSVNFEPKQMVDFLEKHLVPQLIKKRRLPGKLRLFAWDDCLQGLGTYLEALMAAPTLRNSVQGLALHWYSQGLRQMSYSYLHEARKRLPPNQALISTEACFIGRPRPGDWSRGQRYARDLIENMNAGSLAWIDWNLALNMSGGPTWSHNILDAAILIDPERQVYYKNPMYYALGHLSRFVKPGAHILSSWLIPVAESAPAAHPASQHELFAVAAELEEPLEPIGGKLAERGRRIDDDDPNGRREAAMRRKLSVVLLNNIADNRRVRLDLVDCRAKANDEALQLELPANSITSVAFIC